jgi:peptidoglycan/LPS O-acetylase OafA/YrhL
MSTTDAQHRSEYFPFIDWMKAIGIILIVVGHVASRLVDWLAPPIYPKQLGVAFFLFAAGFSLAGERRPSWSVVFNRLFEVYLFGLALAVLMSAVVYLQRGDVNESNYLPFLLGINVLFNFFPANPTTWYIGTYLHILLVWAWLLRGRTVGLSVLGVVLIIEVALRAVLIRFVGGVIPYMLITNWMSVFLLGTYFRQHLNHRRVLEPWLALGVLLLLAVAGAPSIAATVTGNAFPWQQAVVGPNAGPVLVSVYVSVLYIAYTFLVFQLTLSARSEGPVRTVAGSTLLVFLAHMPVYYALQPILHDLGLSYAVRSLILLVACLPGLVIASVLVDRVVRPKVLRNRLAGRVAAHRARARLAAAQNVRHLNTG